MKYNRTLFIVLGLIVFQLYVIRYGGKGYYASITEEKIELCGRVLKMHLNPYEHRNKHNEVTDRGVLPDLWISFDDRSVGFQKVLVTKNTYYTAKINERVCFMLSTADYIYNTASNRAMFSFVVLIIESAILFVATLFFLVIYLPIFIYQKRTQ